MLERAARERRFLGRLGQFGGRRSAVPAAGRAHSGAGRTAVLLGAAMVGACSRGRNRGTSSTMSRPTDAIRGEAQISALSITLIRRGIPPDRS
jgi:hypothetical protein